jgi:hypothetical protein
MKPKAKPEHFEPLDYVTTLQQAAVLVHRDPKTVSYAIDAGHIAHRKVGKTVLISIPSLLSYYNDSRIYP